MKDFEDRIDAYLRNMMSQNDRAQFEEEIQHNVELKNQFNEIYELRQGIKYSDLVNASSALEELEKKLSKRDWILKVIKWLIFSVILSVSAVGIYSVLKKNITDSSSSNVVADKFSLEEFDRYIYHSNKKSIHAPNILSAAQKKAYNLYAIQSFEASIPKLEELWISENDTLAYYYLGISYYAIDEIMKSEEILTQSFLEEYNKPIK